MNVSASGTSIHPTAMIDPAARLDEGVRVEPYAIIEGDVTIGAGSVIGSHVCIGDGARLGREVKVHHCAAVSTIPQDLKFSNETTEMIVGDRTVIREFATLNRGTEAHGKSEVGADCLIMAYAHVAHDCIIGDRVIIANAVQLGGHVTIRDWAILGGAVVVHQFCVIGSHAMIGGGFRVTQDVPPYVVVGGYPARVLKINRIGLERRDFSSDQIRAISQAFRTLYRSGLNRTQALARLKEEKTPSAEVQAFVKFFEESQRGVLR